ncbi:MAG: hypothetical protein IPJ84_03125 [Bdellovibrionales bacterium]|nr:hypothetical protein [Bdellovibrionales bacterium]
MAAKKHRNKVKGDGRATKARRAEELRALFNQAAENPTQLTQTLTNTVQETTPTPTVPTEVTDRKTVTMTAVTATTHKSVTRSVIQSKPTAQRPAVQPLRTDKDEPAAWWFGPLLMLATVLLFGLGWFHVQRSKSTNRSEPRTESMAQKIEREKAANTRQQIEYYKHQIGQRLNRDRISVEVDNQLTAPALSGAETTIGRRSLIHGVPLMPEGYRPKSYRDRSEPVPIDHPDARIQYGLQEEQDHDEFRRRADQAYIKEFIENAHDEGYDVKFDSNMNVISVEPYSGARKPSNLGPPATSR